MRYFLCLLALTFTLSADVPSFPSATTHTDWIAQLDRFATQHPDLTSDQRALLGEARELLENGILARLRSADATEAADAASTVASFKARAKNAFPKELYSEAFVRPVQRSSMRAHAMYPYCDCNPGGEECFGDCITGGCRATLEGCGMWGTDSCFGLCQ